MRFNKKFMTITTIILFMMCNTVLANPSQVKIKGFIHTWFSSVQDHVNEEWSIGFSMRRARLKFYGDLTERISWVAFAIWDKQKPALLDAYMDYKHNPSLQLRVGQFVVAGARYSPLIPVTKIDFVERPMITQYWNSHSGLIRYRSVGLQLMGKIANEKIYYAVTVANPKGDDICSPGIKSVQYSGNENLAIFGRTEFFPVNGLAVGGFYGRGESSKLDVKHHSFGVHLFYVRNMINFKAEYISGNMETGDKALDYHGWFAHLGYRLGIVEPILRYDTYMPDDGNSDLRSVTSYSNWSVGLNVFVSSKIKIQPNYVIRNEEMLEGLGALSNNIFYVNLQVCYP